MTETNQKPRTEGVEPVKCVWSGGGYVIWNMRAGGVDFFRLSHEGREWLGDFPTHHEATNALTRHANGSTDEIGGGVLCDSYLQAAAKDAGIEINATLERHEAVGRENPYATVMIGEVEWIYWPGFGWRKSHVGR